MLFLGNKTAENCQDLALEKAIALKLLLRYETLGVL